MLNEVARLSQQERLVVVIDEIAVSFLHTNRFQRYCRSYYQFWLKTLIAHVFTSKFANTGFRARCAQWKAAFQTCENLRYIESYS